MILPKFHFGEGAQLRVNFFIRCCETLSRGWGGDGGVSLKTVMKSLENVRAQFSKCSASNLI